MAVPDGSRVRPYVVRDSGLTREEVLARVNGAVHAGHGPDVRARGGAVGVIVDPVFQYERLLRGLTVIEGLECVPFRELLARRPPADGILCGIRHDIDIDVRAALDHAALERRYGVRSTWFVLHTAPYYGDFADGQFLRHGSMRAVYRRLQDEGHEVALHTDPLLIYQHHGMDGAQALQEELAWLRAGGIDLCGTTAHNSASVYGAENFSVFRGRPQRSGVPTGATEVVHEGRWAPLGVLDEAELGLHYEANDLFWQGEVQVAYGATRGVNRWRWNEESSIARIRSGERRDRGFVSFEELLERIRGLPRGIYLCLVVHPVYYGARHAPDRGPALALARGTSAPNARLGWDTWEPGSVQARCGQVGGVQEFQSINVADADGMLDLPLPTTDPEGTRVLLLGGRNPDGAACGVPAHMHRLLQERLASTWGCPVAVRKLAHPWIGLARLYAWYRESVAAFRPDIVIVGIGADEAGHSLPEFWAPATGYSARHPPGWYLAAQDDGSVAVVAPAASALVHRARPRPQTAAPGFAGGSPPAAEIVRRIERIAGSFVNEIRAGGALPVLLLQECGESEGAWADADAGRARAAHARTREWLAGLAERLGAPFIDPYAAFLVRPGREATHWQSTAEWSYVGHRLAAEAAAGVLAPLRAARAAPAAPAESPPLPPAADEPTA